MRRPAVSAPAAAMIADTRYGLSGQIRELDSYADRNFAVDGHVLKFALAEGESADLDMEVAVMRWLDGRDAVPETPRVRRTLDDQLVIETEDAHRRRVRVRAATFVHGPLLRDMPPSTALWTDLGRRSAQLVLALRGFAHPGLHRGHEWDLARASWVSKHLQVHAAGPDRDRIRDALVQFRGRVLPRANELPDGAIHGDLNEANVVGTRGGDGIAGAFDFGDMCWSWSINELAIAATYAMMLVPSEVALETMDAVIRGHHQVRALSPVELDVVHDLIRARLAVSVTAAQIAMQAEPDNAYVGASLPGARALLEVLHAADDGERVRGLAEALGVENPRPVPRRGAASIAALRTRHLGPSLSLSYDTPLHMVRGQGVWLFDHDDRAYLDGVNNVCHVGHCEPRVVQAATAQMRRLNTNTRYLHANVVELAERLAARFPDPLEVCFFVCSGSEANELALRIARAATGRRDVIVLDHAYHGNTSTLIDLSAYKHDGPGGEGAPDWVHRVPVPDPIRGKHGDDGPAYAASIDDIVATLAGRGRAPAAFLFESVLGCAGQVFPARGFLEAAVERSRAAGAICIADEVQVGFGRVGPEFWGFALDGDVVPDIVTMGKPMGNGHPLGAVITTRALADAFANGMEYFNTFGGNPVSAAVGLAVLDVIETDGLPEHAAAVGGALLGDLRARIGHDPRVSDIRGRGLFVGIELAGEPKLARAVVEYARARNVLVSIDGPQRDVLKLKPPLRFGRAEADILVDVLACGLADAEAQP